MYLEQVDIDAFFPHRKVMVGPLSPGLNAIFGEAGAGKNKQLSIFCEPSCWAECAGTRARQAAWFGVIRMACSFVRREVEWYCRWTLDL